MKNKFILAAYLAGSIIFSMPATAVLAQSPSVFPRQDERLGKRCEKVNAKIDAQINRFNANKEKITKQQENIIKRSTEFINRLKAKGYDVSKVQTDLETIAAMVKTADNDYVLFIQKLEQTKQLDCGQAQGSFRQTAEEARNLLKTFRTDAKEIKDFVRNTLRPDLKALKEQKPRSVSAQ